MDVRDIGRNMTLEEVSLKIIRYNVLVVDDEEGIRNLVSALLSQRGHSCFQAVDGVDALEKTLANTYDAVITDIVMPRMDGINLTKELLKRTPNFPIMVMTGHDNEFSSVTAVSAGAKEFIKKPFSLGELALRFQRMMRDHEILIQLEAKQKEMSFHSHRKSQEKINDLKKEIETLRNRLHSGYPLFSR
jgi:DNA-binding response OmpR family regulator